MTEAEALALEPRELDALVAERVMGWERDPNTQAGWVRWITKDGRAVYTDGPGVARSLVTGFAPTTTYADMGLVVERMRELGWHYTIQSSWDDFQDRHIIACVLGREEGNDEGIWEDYSAFSDTAPEAVCLAALKARGAIE